MTTQEKQIMRVAAEELKEKGLGFTMSGLAGAAGISKKTLYEIFKTKEGVILKLILESHKSIKSQQNALYENPRLSPIEKIKSLLTVVPEFHFAFNHSLLLDLNKKYPKVFKKVNELLNSDWDKTFELMEQAVERKQIKRVNKGLFKEMYCSTIMSVYDIKLLSDLNMTYAETLDEIVAIMIDGISL